MRGLLVLPLLLGGCFSGEGTLGAACERDADCGDEQTCARSICSLCGDGVAQSGEVCFEGPDATPAMVQDAVFIARIDIDGDGALDLVWPGGSTLGVSLADGDGFGPAQERPFDATAVFAGDADGDGQDELLVRNATSGAGLWRPDAQGMLVPAEGFDLEPLTGLSVAELHPSVGILAARGSAVVRIEAGGEASLAELGDTIEQLVLCASLDGDSTPDVLVRTDDYMLVGVRTTGQGLEAYERVPIPVRTQHIEPVLWNGDAFGDVALLLDDGLVEVRLSDGLGGFVEGPGVFVPSGSTGLRVLDLTEDTEPDVLAFGSDAGLSLAVRRGAELDADVPIAGGGPWQWVVPARVGSDPFFDLLLYDGAGFSVMRRNP